MNADARALIYLGLIIGFILGFCVFLFMAENGMATIQCGKTNYSDVVEYCKVNDCSALSQNQDCESIGNNHYLCEKK